MANKLTHVGFIRPTYPEPQIFWGSPQEIADSIGISYRSVHSMLSGKVKETRKGHRVMTEEEKVKYYQPPKPPKPKPRKKVKYSSKMHWLITFVNDGKKSGVPDTENPDHKFFSGSPQEFVKFVGCNLGQIYRLINTHEKSKEEKYPLKTIKGWRIARIRRHKESPIKKTHNRRVKGESIREKVVI